MDLELEEAEHPVGGFSLDLLGHDAATNETVIIENQLETSDHGHLGQLMTYVGGTNPATIIWVASQFREEHRSALEWLNENTAEGIRFFGVEIGLVQIDNSTPAPNFRLAVQPNNWQKSVRTAQTTDASRQREALFADFWEAFLKCVREKHPTWTRAKGTGQPFLGMSAGLSGVNWSFWAALSNIKVGLRFESTDARLNRERFERLMTQKDSFEAAFGGNLEWPLVDDQKMQWVYATHDCDFADRTEWDGCIEWLVQTCDSMRTAFKRVGGASFVQSAPTDMKRESAVDGPSNVMAP